MKFLLLRLIPLVTALFLAASCSSGPDEAATSATTSTGAAEGPNVVQPGAPGQPTRTLSADEIDDLETPAHTDADVEFMQRMIHHHAQALQMTALVESRTRREDLPLLAERMTISQEDETAYMERWLEERGEEIPTDHRSHDGELMPGMIADEELARLREASGKRFDRLFLRLMIRHHLGALTMVDELFATDGAGLEPAVNQFALHIRSDQPIEIGRMQELLAQLDAGG